MEEQEILSTLSAHVARSQAGAPGQQGISPSVAPDVIDELSAAVWNSSHAVGQLNPRNPGLLNQVIQAFKKVLRRSLTWYTRPLHVFHGHVAQAIEQHGRAINSIQTAINSIQTQLFQLDNYIHASNYNPNVIALNEALETARLATQEQQSPYVRLFEGLSPVVDLGCGRGEFLELLKDAGIKSYGVDSDPVACEAARHRQVTIVEDDLFHYLRQLPERSLGGIFTARVVEYLPTHAQPEFIALCSSKLKPGGRIVVETINPDSDSPFGRNWRLDPSHLHPIYPEILRSILESSGFKDSQIYILAPQVIAPIGVDNDRSYSGNGRRGEIAAIPSLTGAAAYAAIGTRA